MNELNDQTNQRPDIEWMLQNSQVRDSDLTEALLNAYAASLLHYGEIILGNLEASKTAAAEAIHTLVKNRHRFSGEERVIIWLLGQVHQKAGARGAKFRSERFINRLEEPTAPGKENGEGVIPGLDRLPVLNQQLFLLKYGYGFSIEDTATITRQTPADVHQNLIFTRQHIAGSMGSLPGLGAGQGQGFSEFQHAVKESLEDSGPSLHRYARQQSLAAADGLIDYEALNQAEGHIQECFACQEFNRQLDTLDRWLSKQALAALPPPALSPAEAASFTSNVHTRSSQRQGMPPFVREISLGLVVILLAVALGWFTRAAKADPQATVIVLATHYVPRQPLAGQGLGVTPTPPLPQHAPEASQLLELPRLSTTPTSLPQTFLLDISPAELDLPEELANELVFLSAPLSLAAVLDYWGQPLEGQEAALELTRMMGQEVPAVDLVEVIASRPDLSAVQLSGGSLYQLKRLVTAGYPVIVHQTLPNSHPNDDPPWYETVFGYNDHYGVLLLLAGGIKEQSRTLIQYSEFVERWRSTNNSYVLVFPSDREKELHRLLEGKVGELGRTDVSQPSSTSLYFR
jgi:DNA-directed RNA polymerase specialized sigma24 family protein